MKKLATSFILILVITFSTYSCTAECQQAISDLVIKTFSVAVTSVIAGNDANIECVIANELANVASTCINTGASEEAEGLMIIGFSTQYSENFEDYTIVETNTFSIPKLEPFEETERQTVSIPTTQGVGFYTVKMKINTGTSAIDEINTANNSSELFFKAE